MATMPRTPSFFNFLKEGLLLPARNKRLFVAIYALVVASTSLFALGENLAVAPVANKVNLDVKALNGTDPRSPEYNHLARELKNDIRNLLLVGAAYLLFAIIIGSIIRIIIHFAAVTTYSGEQHTFGQLLGKAKSQLKGPLLTLAFIYALEIGFVVLLVALVALLIFLMFKSYLVLLCVVSFVVLLAVIFIIYLSFVCSLSFVVAVAEPGCHSAGAFGRAWRLMKNKKWRAMVFIIVIAVLVTVVSVVQTLATNFAPSNVASTILLGFLFVILMATVELFAACALTAFYYECKGNAEAPTTGYVKV